LSALSPIRRPKDLDTADRSQLVDYYRHCRRMSNEWLRRMVIERNRIDILAVAIMELEVLPFHLAMMQFQFAHRESLQLCFRGAGKSTTCTVTKAIHYLLKNPNLRILIASKTSTQAESFLKEVKTHFESNDRLAEVFGPYFDARKVTKWDNREIEVLPRTSKAREGSITCIGFEGMVVGKHYDVILGDDLVDEDNSRTKAMRDKMRTWYYKSLEPTLEPPSAEVEHRGEFHRLGTRYHFDDLYGHLIANELKTHTQIIPALDEHGRSPWPDKYPPEWFAEKRQKAGIIIFNAQMQCDTEAMKGEIFQYDDCQQLDESEWPDVKGLRVFMGVDLAISEKDSADKFAIVVIGVTQDRSGYYVLDYFEDQLRFGAQTRKIIEYAKRWDPVRVGLETVQYQEAQAQAVEDTREDDGGLNDVRLKRINTDTDKVKRAWKLSSLFENKRVFFRKSHGLLIEHLVLFPNHRYKDLFDALDLAVRASKMKRRRRSRDKEPGVI
jgi:predicted phage terminase large subunit-like protein